MKLSKLYSNKCKLFKPVNFISTVNVVLAEIRLSANREKDTHNLGKSTLGLLLDYCLLASRNKNLFLFKHEDKFKEFVFFLEIELNNGSFVTVRRGVEEATKISFKKHTTTNQDFTELPEQAWDHFKIPFERAKKLLDGLLDLSALKPWSFRKGLGYFLRSQDDYREVFQLRKFASKHADWKPFLAHMLGFNAGLLSEHYEKEEALSKKIEKEKNIKSELGGSVEDISKIEGILLLKKKEVEKKQKLLDAFDFRSHDKEKTNQLVYEINERIATLNAKRYSLNQNKKKIIASLKEEQIMFDPDEAEKLFHEAGVLFQGQIKKDFQQLISFNKAITDERRVYLEEERNEIKDELKCVNDELNNLGKSRSYKLSFLSGTDVFNKYKLVTDELVILRADIETFERQRSFLHRLQELRTEIRTLTEKKKHIQTQIEDDVEKQNHDPDCFFATIRLFFSEIVEEVIDRKALLSVSPNEHGHLEFKAELLDKSGNITSADLGHTYRKLLCIAFDMAVLRANFNNKFIGFVYHDGVFESLDDRKKENLLSVIRQYSDLGLQHIITMIDSDLPVRANTEDEVFDKSDIVLLLHDENEQGRLFKMDAW